MATDDFMLEDLEIGFGGGPPAGAYKAEYDRATAARGVRRDT